MTDGKTTEEKNIESTQHLYILQSMCFSDTALCRWNFAADNGRNPNMKKAQIYISRWSEMLSKNIGLLLWGDVGTGKSFFAACIANALVEMGESVKMTNFSSILNDLFSCQSDKNQYISKLNKCNLLIIDDLGIERNTEYALEQVYNIIDSRYRSNKPLIITTNLSLVELKNPIDTAHKRIYDRVLAMCVPIKFGGENLRQATAKTKLETAKQIFTKEDL